MNKLLKLLLLLSMVSGVAQAVSVTATYTNGIGAPFHFNTDLSFTTQIAISGGSVCTASAVQITPQTNAKWAVNSLDIHAAYPSCVQAYCPAMINAGAASTNKDVAWLSSSAFNSHIDYAENVNDFTTDSSIYSSVQPLYIEPITYSVTLQDSYPNKEASVNIFCKGTLNIYDNGVLVKTVDMPASTISYTPVGADSHSLTAQLANVDCFGAVVKQPLDLTSPPGVSSFFQLNYFALNRPSIPPVSTAQPVSLSVIAPGKCTLGTTSIFGTTTDGDNSLVTVNIKNNGDPIKVTWVSSSNQDYIVFPTSKTLCDILGLNLGCPATSGFSEPIATGSTKTMAVLVSKTTNTSQDTTITFDAELVSPTCGGTATCSTIPQLLKLGTNTNPGGPVKCTITPNPATLGTNEVGSFKRTCFDMADNQVACDAGSWIWAPGLSGDFVSTSPDAALAFTTSPPGSSGQLAFVSTTNMVCQATVSVVAPTYGCNLNPPNAQLDFGGSQNFGLHCTKNNDPNQPQTSSTFGLFNSLVGTITPAGNSALYTAPNSLTQGELFGYGEYDPSADVTGAVAFAHINVLNGTSGLNVTNNTNNTTNATCLNCNKNDGSTEHCTIGDGPLSVYDGYSAWIGIKCGPKADTSCGSVQWFINGGTIDPANTNNPLGTTFHALGKEGEKGEIKAIVGGKPSQYCTRKFTIGSQVCWQVT